MKFKKPIAWLACFVFVWLAFGAASLHQKDVAAGVRETSPAFHSINTPLVLGVLALIAASVALFSKSGTSISSPPRIRAKL